MSVLHTDYPYIISSTPISLSLAGGTPGVVRRRTVRRRVPATQYTLHGGPRSGFIARLNGRGHGSRMSRNCTEMDLDVVVAGRRRLTGPRLPFPFTE